MHIAESFACSTGLYLVDPPPNQCAWAPVFTGTPPLQQDRSLSSATFSQTPHIFSTATSYSTQSSLSVFTLSNPARSVYWPVALMHPSHLVSHHGRTHTPLDLTVLVMLASPEHPNKRTTARFSLSVTNHHSDCRAKTDHIEFPYPPHLRFPSLRPMRTCCSPCGPCRSHVLLTSHNCFCAPVNLAN